MLANITVSEYMTKHLVTLSTDTNVIDAIKKLLNHKITCAPVVDGQGHLLGMFSEKDGMSVFLDSIYNQSMSGKVADFMTKDIVRVEADASIVELAEKFKNLTMRSFPVFDDGRLVGIISRTDVLRALVSIN